MNDVDDTPSATPVTPTEPSPGDAPDTSSRAPSTSSRATRASRLRSPLRTSLALLVLALALSTGIFLRAEGIALKRQLEHDEAVTYLAAAGHEAAFATLTQGMYGDHWTPAGRYQSLLRPDRFFAFGRIASDLDHTDNHPPLYFWLLHVWILLFGLRLWSGMALNLIIALGTTAALFGLAHHVLGDLLEASLVSLIWAASPPVVETSLMARNYDLLALFTVLFVWALIVFSRPQRHLRHRDLGALAALTAAGAATHYHFALVLVAGGAFAAARLARRDPRLLLKLTGAVLGGLLLFVAVDPHFLLSIGRQRAQQTHTPTLAGMETRAHLVWPALRVFFGLDTPTALRWRAGLASVLRPVGFGVLSARAVFALLIGAPLAVVLLVGRWRRWLTHRLRQVDVRGLFIAYFLLAIGGETVTLYVTFQSPRYAMMARYLAAVWPFMAFVPVLLGRLLGRTGVIIVLLYGLIVVLPAGQQQVLSHKQLNPDPVPTLAKAPAVVVTTLDRGDLPRITWFIPPDTPVFAAEPAQLVRDQGRWLTRLQRGDIFVLADSQLGRDWPLLQQVMALLRSRFALVHLRGGVWGIGRVYRLDPLPPASSSG